MNKYLEQILKICKVHTIHKIYRLSLTDLTDVDSFTFKVQHLLYLKCVQAAAPGKALT